MISTPRILHPVILKIFKEFEVGLRGGTYQAPGKVWTFVVRNKEKATFPHYLEWLPKSFIWNAICSHTTSYQPLIQEVSGFQVYSLLPFIPCPLVTPMTSIISFWLKTLCTDTCFSNFSRAQSTFSATEPPLSWISIICAFFCRIGRSFICNKKAQKLHHAAEMARVHVQHLTGHKGKVQEF